MGKLRPWSVAVLYKEHAFLLLRQCFTNPVPAAFIKLTCQFQNFHELVETSAKLLKIMGKEITEISYPYENYFKNKDCSWLLNPNTIKSDVIHSLKGTHWVIYSDSLVLLPCLHGLSLRGRGLYLSF